MQFVLFEIQLDRLKLFASVDMLLGENIVN
jgi:hypothetical protein